MNSEYKHIGIGDSKGTSQDVSDNEQHDPLKLTLNESDHDKEQPKKKREYYADWMRATSVYLVIFTHSVWIANIASGVKWQDDLKYKESLEQQIYGMIRTLVQCGIPIFFYISGMSTNFYNTLKPGNNFCKFFCKKFKTLMIPFLVALPVLLVPRLYLAQSFQNQSCYKFKQDPFTCIEEWNYWTYMINIFPVIYEKLSWLWFLPALFIDSNMNYPLLAWTQRRAAKIPIDWKVDWKYPAGQMLAFSIWSIPNYLIKPLVGEDTLGIVYTNVFFYIFWFGSYKLVEGKDGYKYSLLLKIIGPLSSFGLNYWKDGDFAETSYAFMAMINYDLNFMAQGLIDQTYMKMQLKSRAEWGKTMIAPFMLWIFSLVVSISCPHITVNADASYLFFYPLYAPTWAQCAYTMGSYWWVFLLSAWCQAICNDIFSVYWYSMIIGTSTWGYLSHYLWIIIAAVYITIPLKLGFIGSFFTIWSFTMLSIYWSNVLIGFIFSSIGKLICPRKKRQPKEDTK